VFSTYRDNGLELHRLHESRHHGAPRHQDGLRTRQALLRIRQRDRGALTIPAIPTRFGVLTRSLQSPGVTRFLGVGFPRDPEKSLEPSTKPNRNLEDFVRWTFGIGEDVKPVLEDSRDLTKWGQILDSDDAIRYLRTARDPRFERAFSKSGGLREGLVDSLMTAADYLAESVPLIKQHKELEDVQSAVERCTDYLSQILVHLPEIAKKQGLELTIVANS
jgi:hypothetical protein